MLTRSLRQATAFGRMEWLTKRFFGCKKEECAECDCDWIPEKVATQISNEPMGDSVKAYERHLFVETKGLAADKWPSKVEDWLPLKGIKLKGAKVSLCSSSHESTLSSLDEVSSVDVFDFPAMKAYKDVSVSSLPELIRKLDEQPSEALGDELKGKFVFVCSHMKKDERCGYAGPALVKEFSKVLSDHKDVARVFGCSHVGGHKFAGNVIIYPQGVWYGRVKPSVVPQIVESSILGDNIVQDLFRGQMKKSSAPSGSW